MKFTDDMKLTPFVSVEPTDEQAPANTRAGENAPADATEPKTFEMEDLFTPASDMRSITGRSPLRIRIAGLLDLLEVSGWFEIICRDDFNLVAARKMIEARIAELGLSPQLIHAHITKRDVPAAVGQAFWRLPSSVRMDTFKEPK